MKLFLLTCGLIIVSIPYGFPRLPFIKSLNDILSNPNNNSHDIYTLDKSRSGRVLNFFSLLNDEECVTVNSKKMGICMNPYECRLQGGKSDGFCGSGFGVCCLFTSTCDQEVTNNFTYFTNPNFPELFFAKKQRMCRLIVKKIDQDISQIRIDFIHFNLAQPNRKTGICEGDYFEINGANNIEATRKICGLNNGQHMYIDLDGSNESINITINLKRRLNIGRLWEMRITQLYFEERAPNGCFQYHTGRSGIIQTINYAENGRHLANQDYKICIRQEENMCSIIYDLCDENSFRIGNGNNNSSFINAMIITNGNRPIIPIGDGSVTSGSEVPYYWTETNTNIQMETEDLAFEGSADGPTSPQINQFYEINQRQINNNKKCNNRILMPCESEHFLINPENNGFGKLCDVMHCGSNFCPSGIKHCRLESTIRPFVIGIQFGSALKEESPDDNLGICLRYEQQNCLN